MTTVAPAVVRFERRCTARDKALDGGSSSAPEEGSVLLPRRINNSLRFRRGTKHLPFRRPRLPIRGCTAASCAIRNCAAIRVCCTLRTLKPALGECSTVRRVVKSCRHQKRTLAHSGKGGPPRSRCIVRHRTNRLPGARRLREIGGGTREGEGTSRMAGAEVEGSARRTGQTA